MAKKAYFVYIVKCKDNTLYTGITNDLISRIQAHNKAKGAKYTRARMPVKLVFSKKVASRPKALKLEYQIKQLSRTEKLNMIKGAISSRLRTRCYGGQAVKIHNHMQPNQLR